MTEDEILEKFPQNWLDRLSKELDEMLDIVASQFSRVVAEDLKIDPDDSQKFWLALAQHTQVTTVSAKENFSRVCMENAKMALFRHQFPELISAAEADRQSIPKRIMDRIMGDTPDLSQTNKNGCGQAKK